MNNEMKWNKVFLRTWSEWRPSKDFCRVSRNWTELIEMAYKSTIYTKNNFSKIDLFEWIDFKDIYNNSDVDSEIFYIFKFQIQYASILRLVILSNLTHEWNEIS